MNINDTSTQLLFTTVPIVGITTEGTGVSGTGFFFSYDLEDGRNVPLLITNHHVLKDVIQGRFVINLAEGDAPSRETISVNFDKSFIEGKKLGELDLVAMPVAPVLSMLEENGKKPFYRSIDSGLIPKKSVLDNLAALEQITFIGYPSGLYDDYNKTPPSSGKAGLPRPLGTTTRVSASSSLTHLYSRAPAAVPPSSSTRAAIPRPTELPSAPGFCSWT